MPKRKRDGFLGDREPENRAGRQHAEIGRKLVHGQKRLIHSLKTVKGFERQKLGKRISRAEKEGKNEGLSRLERELEALKILDVSAAAEAHLYKSIQKSKLLSASSAFSDFLSRDVKRCGGTEGPDALAANNVLARLYNTKLVKAELASIVTGLSQILGLGQLSQLQQGVNEWETANKNVRQPHSHKANSTNSEWEVCEGGPEGAFKHTGDDEGRFDLRQGVQNPNRLSATISAGDMIKESSSCDAVHDLKPRIKGSTTTISTRQSSVETLLTTPPRAIKRAKKPPAVPNSTFLPSLMMGGYWSGSESEAEDLEEVEFRKNRMGQRARRALWEKQFGQNAKHLRRVKAEDWDPQRGARFRDDTNRRGNKSSWHTVSQRKSEKAGVGGFGGTTAKAHNWLKQPDINDKPLHPSWEAARKAKEQKQSAAFEGKKVVFA